MNARRKGSGALKWKRIYPVSFDDEQRKILIGLLDSKIAEFIRIPLKPRVTGEYWILTGLRISLEKSGQIIVHSDSHRRLMNLISPHAQDAGCDCGCLREKILEIREKLESA